MSSTPAPKAEPIPGEEADVALRRGVLNAEEARRYGREAVSVGAPWELSGLGQLHEAAQLADRLVCFGGD